MNSIKVVFFEDLVSNPTHLMEEIFDFLGVDHIKNVNYCVHNRTSPSNKKILSVRDYELIIGPVREDFDELRLLLGSSVPDWDLSRESWVDESKC